MKVRDLDLHVRQGAMTQIAARPSLVSLHFLCNSKDRTLANMQIEIGNFHRTVLETYWELEARTGTIMTARNCTFSSFRLFFVPKRLYGVFFGKTV